MYIGLGLQERFIEVMTSSSLFKGLILLLFLYLFVLTAVRYFGRFMPGGVLGAKGVPLSRFFHLLLALFISLSLLSVKTNSEVSSYTGQSWHDSDYVRNKIPQIKHQFKVSIVFDFITRTSDSLVAALNITIDHLLSPGHSQLKAPNLIYKAVAASTAQLMPTAELAESIDIFSDNCIVEALQIKNERLDVGIISRIFSNESTDADSIMAELPLRTRFGETCYDLRVGIMSEVVEQAGSRSGWAEKAKSQWRGNSASLLSKDKLASDLLINHFIGQREGFLGIDRAAELPTMSARIAQVLARYQSSPITNILSLFSGDQRGVFIAGQRAEALSQNMARAPHVAGFIKMFLFAVFPWLVIPVLLGYWKIIIWWLKIYVSVLLWAPAWTILYSVMTGIALSTSELQSFDSVSMIGASLINYRLHYGYAVYAWLQMFLGMGITGSVLMMANPFVRDTEGDNEVPLTGAVSKTIGIAQTAVGGMGGSVGKIASIAGSATAPTTKTLDFKSGQYR